MTTTSAEADGQESANWRWPALAGTRAQLRPTTDVDFEWLRREVLANPALRG